MHALVLIKSEVLLSVICISLCSRPHLWLRYNMVNKYWRSYFQDKLSDKLKTKKKPPNSYIQLNSDMVWTKQIFKHFHTDVPARHFALLNFRILAGTRPYSSQPSSSFLQLPSHICCRCRQKSRFSCSLVSSREHGPSHTGSRTSALRLWAHCVLPYTVYDIWKFQLYPK